MARGHNHHHSESISASNIRRSFVAGIILNLLFVITEFVSGFYSNSLSLLSDAGHNLSDVATLILSLIAFRLAKSKSDNRFTYGLSKGTVLASLTNAVILFITAGSIGWESIQRFMHPAETDGKLISLVAGAGIVINAVSAFFFYKSKNKELNAKGAYLHLMLDAVVSLAVVVSGILIYYTGFYWIDPLISVAIIGVIIYSTWGLLTESLRLSVDAVPSNVDSEKIISLLEKTSGIKNVHHLHIWAMSTSKNALTAHLLLDEKARGQEAAIKREIKHALEHENIQHVTLETEFRKCDETLCEIR